MPRELKQNRAPAFTDVAIQGAPPGARVAVGAFDAPVDATRTSRPARWFEALDPTTPAPAEKSKRLLVAPLLGVAALLGLLALKSAAARAILPVALPVVAVIAIARIYRADPRAWLRSLTGAAQTKRDEPPPRRGLAFDGERLAFHRGRDTGAPLSLLQASAPFGVTLLATPKRDRLVALLSSGLGTFYLGASFDANARRAFAPLLERAFTVADDEGGLEALGPDGEPLLFAPEELASLLDALVEQNPACLDRFVLTDARGAALTLDGRTLSVGDRSIDLTAPVEWRSILFQEAFGQAVAVYQGTWIRQSGAELVLVCLLPSVGPLAADLDVARLDRGALRDLRLMQATPEAPPPAEQRVAIDRLFMIPLRSALDRAPRPSQQPSRARA